MLELLGILFELLAQLILELGVHCVLETFGPRKKTSSLVVFFGYSLLGILVGLISVLLFPIHFIQDSLTQTLNLVITPCLLGLFFVYFGRLRERRDLSVLAMDQFFYGFVFAFAIAAVRLTLAS